MKRGESRPGAEPGVVCTGSGAVTEKKKMMKVDDDISKGLQEL